MVLTIGRSSGPADYEYQAQVKYMGDHTWMEIDESKT
jgi:hypothetical protein